MAFNGPEEGMRTALAGVGAVTRYCSVLPSASGIGVHLHESEGEGPVTIDQIVPGGQAEKAGLRTGDEVVSIAGHKTTSGELPRVLEAVGELTRRRPSEPIEWIVRRRPEGLDAGAQFEEDYTRSVELAWAKNAAQAAKEQLAHAVTEHVAEISHREEQHHAWASQTLAVAKIAKHWRNRRSAVALKSVASAHRKHVEEHKQRAKFAEAEANAVRSLHKQLGDDYLQLRDNLEQTKLDHRAQALKQQGEHARALAAQEHGHEREKAELTHAHATMLDRAEQEARRSTGNAKAAQAELESAQESISDLLGELAELRTTVVARDAQLKADAAEHEVQRQALEEQLAASATQHEAHRKELTAQIIQLTEKVQVAESRAAAAEELQQQGLQAQLQDRLVSVDRDGDHEAQAAQASDEPPALELDDEQETDPASETQLDLLAKDIKFILLSEHQAEVSRLKAENEQNLDLLHEMQEQFDQHASEHDDELKSQADLQTRMVADHATLMSQAAAKYEGLQAQTTAAYEQFENEMAEAKSAHAILLAENQSTILSLEQQLKESSAALQSANKAYETSMQQISKDSAEYTVATNSLQSRIAEMKLQHQEQVAEFERQIREAETEARQAKQLQLQAEELLQQAKELHEKEFQATLATRVVAVHGQNERQAATAGMISMVQPEPQPEPEPQPQPQPEPEPEVQSDAAEIKYVMLHEHEAEVARLKEESDEHLLQWQDATALHEEVLEEHEQTVAAFNALKEQMADAKATHDSALAAVRADLRETELSRQSAAEHHKLREADQLATVELLQKDIAAKQRRLHSLQAELETQIQANTSLQVEQDVLRQRIVALQTSANNEADRAEHLRKQLRDSERSYAELESKFTHEAEASPATYTELVTAVEEVEQQVADAEEMGEPTEPLIQLLSELREEVLGSQEMAGLRDTLESKEATIVTLRAELQETKRALQLVKEDHRVALARQKVGKELSMKKFIGRIMNNNLQSVLAAWRQITVDMLIRRREHEQTELIREKDRSTEAAAAAAAALQTRYDALRDEIVALRKAKDAEQEACARLRDHLASSQVSEESAAAELHAANEQHAASLAQNEADRIAMSTKIVQLGDMLEAAEARAAAVAEDRVRQAQLGPSQATMSDTRHQTVSIRMAQSPKGFGMALSDQLDVESVTPGSVADKAGVPVASRIIEVAGVPVMTKRDVVGAVTAAHSGARLHFVFAKATDPVAGNDGSAQRELAAARDEIRELSDELSVCEDKLRTVGIERAEMQKELEALRSAAGFAEKIVTQPVKAPAEVRKSSAVGPASDGTLTVELEQCLGLLPADKNGKSDPYVKLFLGNEIRLSKTISKTLDPVFKESFKFEIQSQVLSSDAWILRLEVYDKDKGSKDEFLGEATIHLIDAFAGQWTNSGPIEAILHDANKRLLPKLTKAVGQRSAGNKRAPQGSATVVLSFEPTTISTRESRHLEQREEGFGLTVTKALRVEKLAAGGSAAAANVPVGARIVEVAGVSVKSKKSLIAAMQKSSGTQTVEFVFEIDQSPASSVSAPEPVPVPEPEPEPETAPKPKIALNFEALANLDTVSPRTRTFLQQREEELLVYQLPVVDTEHAKSPEHDALVASLCAELQAVQLLALQHSEASKLGDEDAQTGPSEAEVRQLRSTLDIVTAERELLQRKIESLRKGSSAVPELAATVPRLEETQGGLTKTDKDLGLGNDEMRWKAEYYMAKADFTKARDDHLATTKQLYIATRQIDELQDELDTERETVVALEADIAELHAVHQEERESLRAQLDEQLRELASLRAQLDAARAEQQQQIADADARVQDLRTKLHASEQARAAEASKYAQEVELLRTEAPASYTELTNAVAEVEQQIADAKASGEPVDQLQELLTELQEQVLSMEEAAGLRERLAQADAQPATYAQLVSGVSEVEQQIQEAEACGEPTERLQELLVELRQELLNAEELSGLRDVLHSKEAAIAAKEAAIASLHAELTTKSEKVKTEQGEMARLRDALLEEVADSAVDQAELDAILVPSPRESAASTPTGSVDGGDVDTAILASLVEEGEPPIGSAPEELPRDARSVFDELDVDGSGYIDHNDIKTLCQRMGRTQSEDAIQHALTVMDTNHNGQVDWNEFIVWWTWTAQHEEEVTLGHKPEDYPNHAFWAKQSTREEDGFKSSLTPQQQRAIQLIEEEELIAEGDAGPPVDGTLELEVVRCSGLLPADKNGKSDPYVQIELGTQRKATKSKSKTLDPVYREKFSFSMQAAKPGEDNATLKLGLEVFDKDRGAKDDFLGEVSVNLVEVFSGKWTTATVGPLEFELADASSRVDPKIAKLVGSRKADGSGEWQEHGKVVLKFSFQHEGAPAAKQKGKKK